MTDFLHDLKLTFEKKQSEWKAQLFEFLRFPTISTSKDSSQAMEDCIKWLSDHLENNLDLTTETWPTPDHPTLFAQSSYDPSLPTVLFYGHYDVQPIDPLEEWESPPFEPQERNGNIYARGACDDKGQIFYCICALEAVKSLLGNYPINIKLCIEGGEEIGSGGFASILEEKKESLKADYALIVDGGIPSEQIPAVILGIRGILTGELTVKGPKNDLHSGTHGGVVANPLHVISKIIAGLHQADGTVSIPGFYEGIRHLSEKELTALNWSFFEEENYKRITGQSPLGGEQSFPAGLRGTLRPTLEVNGIWGGYIDPGFKTVIPSTAHAKISCRLVADQDPEKIAKQVDSYFNQLSIPGVEISFKLHQGMGPATLSSPDSSIVNLAAKAYSEVFGLPCQKALMGGSVPITHAVAKASQAESLIVGVAIESDLVHAPNENFSWNRFEKGFLVLAHLITSLKTMKS